MSIEEITKKITPILQQFDVEYAGIFGSVARGEETETSDVDLMVCLRRPVGFVKLNTLSENLEKILAKKVDLVEEEAVNKYLKPYIDKDLVQIYGI